MTHAQDRGATTVVQRPRLDYRPDTGTVGVAAPRISWRIRTETPGWLQAGATVEWTTKRGTATSELADGENVFRPWPFAPLRPRERGRLRVRVRGEDGGVTDWSEPLEVVAGFLGDDEWQARFISVPEPADALRPVLLRREFAVRPGLASATLYATARGVYQVHVNGVEVDEEVLKPGWTAYRHRLIHETTEVTALLAEGPNAIGAELAGGWYAEHFGFQGLARPYYGSYPSFAAQLVLEYEDGTTETIGTDATWRTTAEGPRRSSGIYAGEHYDARLARPGWADAGFDDTGWLDARVQDGDPASVPEARRAPAVRRQVELPVRDVVDRTGERILLDFGQNLVGRLRIRVRGRAGDTVVLRHAEVLEHGELGVRPLRFAKATEQYTLAGDGLETWEPSFTFHGFRYAEVRGWPGEFDPADVTAVVVHSDMERTGWFECSDPLVSRLHENVVWGMRGNFLSIPTDCPQRDERLGWTGDIQVFSPTASFLFDCDGFLASWLVDLALEQQEKGTVPLVVPDVLEWAENPTAAWGDAVTVVPSVLWERFADREVLERQYPSMRTWVDQVLDIAGPGRLWQGQFQFGDWLDPDAPPDRPGEAKTDPDIVASAYLVRSVSLLAAAARLLGHEPDAERYATAAEQARLAWVAEYTTRNGRIVSDTQTAYALAIRFGLVTNPDLVRRMGDRLAELVRRNGYRIGTGFVGTPLIQDALTSTGHLETAGRLLRQTELPSWLYPVTMGATTVWERWDSMLEDGTINPGEMTSFNHYAFGAIADWLHRNLAGLAPAAPGYRRLRIAPNPVAGIDRASARHLTPSGEAAIQWHLDGGDLLVSAVVPPNTAAEVRLPETEPFQVGSGRHEWRVPFERPTRRRTALTIDTPLSEIIDDPDAYRAVWSAIAAFDPDRAARFRKHTRWVAQRALAGVLNETPRTILDHVEQALAELNARRASTPRHGD